MKPRLVLLYTRDRNFDRVLKEALLGTRAVVLIARSLARRAEDCLPPRRGIGSGDPGLQ